MFRQAFARSSGALYAGGGVLAGAVGTAVSCRKGRTPHYYYYFFWRNLLVSPLVALINTAPCIPGRVADGL